MLTLSIIQLIIIVYCVWAYSFVWGYFKGINDSEEQEWFGIDYQILWFSPITVWMLFIDND